MVRTESQWTQINSFPSNQKIKSIATSCQYTIFLTETDITCGKYHTMAICKNNNIYSWGSNHYGQLGLLCNNNVVDTPHKLVYFAENGIKIKKVACGLYHTLVLDLTGKVYCFGRNDYFQCGNGGNYLCVRLPQLNKILQYERIADIKCGAYHSLAINNKNEYFLWGNNKDNQCLAYNENKNENECYIEENIEFIKIPTKYKYDKNKMEIMAMYIGYKTTLVLRKTYGENLKRKSGEISGNVDNKMDRKSKLIMQLRRWCNSLKLTTSIGNKKGYNLTANEVNQQNINQLNEENKYEEQEYINNGFRSCKTYGEYYCIPSKETRINPFNKYKNIEYCSLSLKEC